MIPKEPLLREKEPRWQLEVNHKAISKSLLTVKQKSPCHHQQQAGILLVQADTPYLVFIFALVPENGYLCIFNIQGKPSITQCYAVAAHYMGPTETFLFYQVCQLQGFQVGPEP